jgi:microcystin-dependent protein
MSVPYVGEIRMFGGSFAPFGWAFCNGQLLPISEYETLFNLIGTTYGGDGQENFAVPDLQGRIPVHVGQSHVLGEKAGVESVTLTLPQTPIHNHSFLASTDLANQPSPQGSVVSQSTIVSLYRQSTPSGAMAAAAIQPGGGGNQPHDNMQPFLCVSFIISLFGIFPQQN